MGSYYKLIINIFGFTIFTFFNICLVYAEENKGTLFRVDTRGPDEIFLNGFTSFGDNDSLIDHSRGRGCAGRDRNSAFISVSSDPVYAANYARRLYSLTGNTAYVYIIRSTENMYNMRRSLENISYTVGYQDADTQSEWINHGNIIASDIRGVRAYSGLETPPVTPNLRFQDNSPIINQEPYIEVNNDVEAIPITSLYANTRPTVTACFAATLYCFSNSKGRSLNSQCDYVEKLETIFPKGLYDIMSSPSVLEDSHDEF